jgi:hypothetical protein
MPRPQAPRSKSQSSLKEVGRAPKWDINASNRVRNSHKPGIRGKQYPPHKIGRPMLNAHSALRMGKSAVDKGRSQPLSPDPPQPNQSDLLEGKASSRPLIARRIHNDHNSETPSNSPKPAILKSGTHFTQPRIQTNSTRSGIAVSAVP